MSFNPEEYYSISRSWKLISTQRLGQKTVLKRLLFVVSFFLTVNTPAVRLAIHVELFGGFNAFFPAGPEVLIVKWNSNGLPHGFTDGSDLFVFLKLAVQQAAGKIVEFINEHPLAKYAARIGQVLKEYPQQVQIKTLLGPTRFVDLPIGE